VKQDVEVYAKMKLDSMDVNAMIQSTKKPVRSRRDPIGNVGRSLVGLHEGGSVACLQLHEPDTHSMFDPRTSQTPRFFVLLPHAHGVYLYYKA
jgi:hypothetical protein